MKCRTARDAVAAAERPEEWAADVRAHLASCPACRAVAERDAAAREWLALKRHELAAPGAAARVECGVRSAIAGHRPWPAWRVWAAETAAMPAMRWAAVAAVALAAGLLWPDAVRRPGKPAVARGALMEVSNNAMPDAWSGFPGGFLVLAPLRLTNAWGEEILVQPGGRIEYGSGGTRTVRWDY